MRPRITIITPSFNHAEWLERAMKSVLDQGYPNLEYMVLDGGSTDGSAELIESYSDRISVWRSAPDGGQVAAINRGIEESAGEIIGYLNSDDYYLPGAFDRAADAFESSDKLWAVGASVFTGERTAEVGFTIDRWTPRLPSGPRSDWVLHQWGFPQPSCFWRRELFDRVGLFDDDFRYVFDTEHGLRSVLLGHQPTLVEADLAARFLHADTKSAVDDAGWEKERKQMKKHLRALLTPTERARYMATRVLEVSGAQKVIQRRKHAATPAP